MAGRSDKGDLPKNLVALLMRFWENCAGNYIGEMEGTLKNIRDQRELYSIQMAEVQRVFLTLLERGGDKRVLAVNFQKEYNQFVDDHPDLIEEGHAKEELHQRVEDLCDEIFDIIEQKRDEYREERTKIMQSKFVENEMGIFMMQVLNLLQSELDRWKITSSVISDYYEALDRRPVSETPERTVLDIFPKLDDSAPYENPEIPEDENYAERFPFLDRMIQHSFKILEGEEIVEEA